MDEVGELDEDINRSASIFADPKHLLMFAKIPIS
jgi:hypothetical protein